jgi:CheY-like chemotaxis protein
MDKETRERAFEPFFTTKEKGKGTGLGLSTVYGIVKQSGGTIWAYSEPGVGTTMKVYLPRVEEPAEPPLVRRQAPAPPGTETLLVVEDDEAVRALLLEALQERGYSVLPAKDGEEAVRILKEGAPRPHLVITDVVMPGMSGKEMTEKAKALHPGLKILFLSGYTDNAIVHHGVLDPGVAFLQKPFATDALARKVREVLDG